MQIELLWEGSAVAYEEVACAYGALKITISSMLAR
jgi:hypothetical protein